MTARRLARAAAALIASALASPAARAQPLDPAFGPPPRPEPPAHVETTVRTAFGGASFVLAAPGAGRAERAGVALLVRARNRVSSRFSADVVVTWGLTDWERAKEWIDAGNRAGTWTTEKIQSVTHWVEDGGDSQGLRFMGAVFADMFLAMTYAAVPFCYVGSAGGATSHLELDLTANYHLADGALDLWGEAGAGVAALPSHFLIWDYAAGPVAGVGLDAGPLRVGARVLWAPASFQSAARPRGDLWLASLTLGSR